MAWMVADFWLNLISKLHKQLNGIFAYMIFSENLDFLSHHLLSGNRKTVFNL